MGLQDRVHNHKAKPKKDNINNTFRPMMKPGTPEDHKSMTSHFDVIKKRYQSTRKQGKIDSYKYTQ